MEVGTICVLKKKRAYWNKSNKMGEVRKKKCLRSNVNGKCFETEKEKVR